MENVPGVTDRRRQGMLMRGDDDMGDKGVGGLISGIYQCAEEDGKAELERLLYPITQKEHSIIPLCKTTL